MKVADEHCRRTAKHRPHWFAYQQDSLQIMSSPFVSCTRQEEADLFQVESILATSGCVLFEQLVAADKLSNLI